VSAHFKNYAFSRNPNLLRKYLLCKQREFNVISQISRWMNFVHDPFRRNWNIYCMEIQCITPKHISKVSYMKNLANIPEPQVQSSPRVYCEQKIFILKVKKLEIQKCFPY